MAALDLDRRRAERDKKPHVVTLDGDEWRLPNPLPLVAAQRLKDGDFDAFIALTFGAEARANAANPKAAEKAVEAVVDRIAPLIDTDALEEVCELYDLDDKPKKRKEPQDRLTKE